ncbi:SH3 domain-containing protein [Streptomyces sp. NPDC051940]|uniref:SH3 domain-containing protein n=1 Tax=Streptomyces sp. NPDC051940 TaxID=3155675 RepID=UPI00341E8849
MFKRKKVLVAASASAMVLGGMLGVAPAAEAAQPASVKTWDDDFPRGVVIAQGGVNIRSAPSHVNGAWRGNIGRGTIIDLVCKKCGDDVMGNGIWYKLRDGDYVTARYVKNVDWVPWCDW